MIAPQWFLLALILLSVLVCAAHAIADSRFNKQIEHLARKLDMHHARKDLFNIRQKLESAWPIPDCSDWQVEDVLYGALAGMRRYVFTVYFTTGPLDHFKRERRVATFIEKCDGHDDSALTLADPVGSRIEQYHRLLAPSVLNDSARD